MRQLIHVLGVEKENENENANVKKPEDCERDDDEQGKENESLKEIDEIDRQNDEKNDLEQENCREYVEGEDLHYPHETSSSKNKME